VPPHDLRVAADLGITSALLTCLPTNEASRRVVERNGGVLDSANQRVLRDWIPPADGSRPVDGP
jgi:predicted acetyltransferase